jgi:hypothetical protein
VSTTPPTTSTRGLVAGLAVGVPVMAYGIRGALVDGADTHPAELARWIVGSAVVHDLGLVPLVAVAAWALRRAVPDRWWGPVRAGLVVSGVLCLVAWPLVAGFGRDPRNPSLFPRDYGTGLAVALAATWLAVAAVVARHLIARRR